MSTAIGLDLGKSSIKYVTAAKQGDIPAWLSFGRIAQVVGSGNGIGNIRYEDKDHIVGCTRKCSIIATGNTRDWDIRAQSSTKRA